MEQNSADDALQTAKGEIQALSIRKINSLIGKQCVVKSTHNLTTEGIFKGYDAIGEYIVLSNLKPPFHILPEKLIRMSEVVHITVGNVIVQIKDIDC